MSIFLFWFFAVLMILFGAGVVLFRNPVNSAMSMVVSFIFLAALFVTLNAYFIGVVQVLVYAGAVMVLFLFIIMLLDLKGESARKINLAALTGGILVLIGFIAAISQVLAVTPFLGMEKPALSSNAPSDVFEVGMELFTHYNLPLQVVGVLLLVATVGVVVLSKRELK